MTNGITKRSPGRLAFDQMGCYGSRRAEYEKKDKLLGEAERAILGDKP